MNVLRATTLAVLLSLTFVGGARGQDQAARRLVAEADALVERGQTDRAVRAYEDVVRGYPDDEQAPGALLRVAEVRWTAGDRASARSALATLLREYPLAPAAAGGHLLDGRMQLATATRVEDLRGVWTTLGRVRDDFDPLRYADPGWRQEAGLLRGRVGVLLDTLELAAAELLTVLEEDGRGEAGPTGVVAVAREQLGRVFLLQGRWRAGAEVLQRVVEAGRNQPADHPAAMAAGRARRWLGVLHRMVLRPRAGQSAWTTVRTLDVPGSGLRAPNGIAVTEDGQVVVADEGADLALTFDAAGLLVATSQVENPRLPWWGVDGQAFVLDRRRVERPLSDAPPATFAVPQGVDSRPMRDLRAGAQGPLGDLLLLDVDLRRVVRFDRDGQYQATIVYRHGEERITDLTVDNRGRIWLLDRGDDRVLRFRLDGSPERVVVAGNWRRPEALAVDVLGHAYVLDRDEKVVSVFGPDGELRVTVGPILPDGTELRSPRDLAVDGAGRLYIVDRYLDSVFILE